MGQIDGGRLFCWAWICFEAVRNPIDIKVVSDNLSGIIDAADKSAAHSQINSLRTAARGLHKAVREAVAIQIVSDNFPRVVYSRSKCLTGGNVRNGREGAV
jgi:hypothetical protein